LVAVDHRQRPERRLTGCSTDLFPAQSGCPQDSRERALSGYGRDRAAARV